MACASGGIDGETPGEGMATAVTAHKGTSYGIANEDGYVPIPLETMRIDSIPSFNLYNRVGTDYILYRGGSHPFTEKQSRTLIEHKVRVLYVPAGEIAQYWTYLEQNVALILADPVLPPEKKAEVFRVTAVGLTRDVLTSPASRVALHKAGEVVKCSAQLLLHGKAGLHAFLRMVGVDSDLFAHSVNVCTYGIALARAAGIVGPRLEELGVGLLLHDMGMTETPERLMSKPGPLSSDEWQAIRAHPAAGMRRFEQCGGTSDGARNVILCHHERLDGTGYTRALVGRQVPTVGRVAAIANVFDALTTARPFRPALSTLQALISMKQDLRTALDQPLLDLFIRLLGPG